MIRTPDAFAVGVVNKRGSCYSVAVGEQLVLRVITSREGCRGSFFAQAIAVRVVRVGGYGGSGIVLHGGKATFCVVGVALNAFGCAAERVGAANNASEFVIGVGVGAIACCRIYGAGGYFAEAVALKYLVWIAINPWKSGNRNRGQDAI